MQRQDPGRSAPAPRPDGPTQRHPALLLLQLWARACLRTAPAQAQAPVVALWRRPSLRRLHPTAPLGRCPAATGTRPQPAGQKPPGPDQIAPRSRGAGRGRGHCRCCRRPVPAPQVPLGRRPAGHRGCRNSLTPAPRSSGAKAPHRRRALRGAVPLSPAPLSTPLRSARCGCCVRCGAWESTHHRPLHSLPGCRTTVPSGRPMGRRRPM
mmetsp:Transcript_46893/g.102565  ORF Transcript_46893/g.102565 Transcript_46893/m.102565 type:complete len:209 (-) Transcript_46893:324-950(-)